MKELKKVIKPIMVEVVVERRLKQRCPFWNWFTDSASNTIKGCKNMCPFFAELKRPDPLECPEGEYQCEWYEYKQSWLEHTAKHEDDGVSQYYWKVACAYCGYPIEYSSGLSSIGKGDKSKCNNCGLTHVYIKYEKVGDEFIEVFAIPVKEWKGRQQNV